MPIRQSARLLPLILAALLLWGSHALAAEGKQLFAQRGCAACHGAEGKVPAGGLIPMLAGQQSAYLVSQMEAFKSLQRDSGNSEAMWTFAQMLSGSEMKDIAAYLEKVR